MSHTPEDCDPFDEQFHQDPDDLRLPIVVKRDKRRPKAIETMRDEVRNDA